MEPDIQPKYSAPTTFPEGAAIDALVDLGAAAAAVTIETVDLPAELEDSGLPLAVPVGIRHGEKPEFLDTRPLFEHWRIRPARKAGQAKTLTLDSFIALTNRHKTEHSAVFADTDWRKPAFLAVVDYHELALGAPAPCKHRIGYQFPLSEPWKLWVAHNAEPMAQGEFAAFVEDNIADLSSPTPAEAASWGSLFGTTVATPSDLIRLSRGLAVNVESKVVNAVTLQSGAGQVVFEETHKDADGKPITVPGLFILSVAPFFMGTVVRVPCRLRYRVKAGSLVWFYQIYRPDLAVTERVRADLDIVAAATALPCFEGAPEVPA